MAKFEIIFDIVSTDEDVYDNIISSENEIVEAEDVVEAIDIIRDKYVSKTDKIGVYFVEASMIG